MLLQRPQKRREITTTPTATALDKRTSFLPRGEVWKGGWRVDGILFSLKSNPATDTGLTRFVDPQNSRDTTPTA